MARRPAGPARGVLRPDAVVDGTLEHQRIVPADDLADRIAHLWTVRWDLGRSHLAETLPHPSIHLVLEGGRAELAGVARGRFTRRLVGRGQVLGVKFRPAAFQPVLGRSLATLTDRVIAASTVMGRPLVALARVIADAPFEIAAGEVEAYLRARLPPLPPELAALRDLVERIAVDRSLVRVEAVAAMAGLEVRTLERWFARAVGVTPKWVLRRYRLHEAAERLRAVSPPGLAALAAELGYADQAHFVRDFKGVVGHAPGRYVAQLRRAAG